MRRLVNLITFVIFLSLIGFISAEDLNLSLQDQATNCVNLSQEFITDLEANNFSVIRANDLLTEISSIYSAQLNIESKQKGKGDFAIVVKKCGELETLHQLAFESRDAFDSLQRFYNDSLADQPDTSSIDSLMTEISLEIQNERYEKVPTLVDNTYGAISSLRAENTQLKLFYKSTTKGFVNFLYNHKIEIIIIVSLLILFFLVYRVAIKRWILNRKIAALNLRKESLKNLIRKTQKTFFQDGQMSEGDYTMRVKNFAEMVRDIDRQIPLLNEEYLKLSRKATK